jgi:hypothetical protein
LDWEVPVDAYTLVVTPDRPYIKSSAYAIAQHSFLSVLSGEGWRIALCNWPLCEGDGKLGKLFMKRKAGLYCCPQHAQAMHSLRHFDPERADQLERGRDARRAHEKRPKG